MSTSFHVSLLTSGTDQVLTIPPELVLSGTEALLRKEGNRLIIEPLLSGSLLSLLATLEDTVDDFPDVDSGLLPPDEVMF
jgi:antitoxin VapB